jgi:hypothetical protein
MASFEETPYQRAFVDHNNLCHPKEKLDQIKCNFF